jgi:molybdenum cofactor synthesis domain-containing protein
MLARMGSAIVAVGDELVGGFTLDTNSHWLAQQLRRVGRPVVRIAAVRDRRPEIVAELRRALEDPEVDDVFSTGGLGPTPDDRTTEAVAALLGRPVVIEPSVLQKIERRTQLMHEAGLAETTDISEATLRMARVAAQPDHVFRNRGGMAPGLMYRVDGRRLFVLPGVPREMRGIFSREIEPEFLTDGRPGVVRELRFLFAPESRFAPVMRELELSHPDVSVGSYPSTETRVLTIRSSGADERRVAEVVAIVRREAAGMGFEPVT